MKSLWRVAAAFIAVSVLLGMVSDQAMSQNNVTFKVNMSVQALKGNFTVGTDTVWFRGDPNGWGTPDSSRLVRNSLSDSMYNVTMSLAASTINYKFSFKHGATEVWESDPNRNYTIVAGDQTVGPVYFDRDSVYSPGASNVTFKVNMRVQILKTKFTLGTDSLYIRGSFNGWAGLTDSMRMVRNSLSDSIYNVTFKLAAGPVNYKFWYRQFGTDGWETISNRSYTVVSGDQTVAPVYFNQDSVYSATKVPVNFHVNMAVRIQQGYFKPDSDYVRVEGDFSNWEKGPPPGAGTDTLTKGATDSVYSGTVLLGEGTTVLYKFRKTLRGEGDVETIPNRSYVIPTGGGTTPLVWFNDDSVYRAPITGTVKYQVNLKAMKTLGWFDSSKDTMQVRGGFEGWGGTKMSQDLFNTNLYTKSVGFTGLAGDKSDFKFYMKLDSAHAYSLWGDDYNTNKDSYAYEHPSEHGDGNNSFVFTTGGSISTTPEFYSGINPLGLLTATDSVDVTLKVNMGPATRYVDPFVLGADTVKLLFQDRLWRASQKKSRALATIPDVLIMTRAGATDSTYTVTFKVKGPTHYNIMYNYRYVHAGGTSVDEGGGLGVSNPYRSRFIGGTAGAWPVSFVALTDSWKKDAPLFCESAPFVTDVAEQAGKPLVYQLNQNYPNPFNPSTTITYALPKQSKVTLKVFNLLGQEVATLVNAEQPTGTHIVTFDASHLASGVYLYRLEAGTFTQVHKMVFMK